jgi:hypothetical protein
MRTVFFPKQAEEDMEALCLATKAQMLKVVNEANWMMKCRPRKDVRAFALVTQLGATLSIPRWWRADDG